LRRPARSPHNGAVPIRLGDLVRHTACPEWGVGHVIDLRGTLAIVCFEGSDRHREFRLPTILLEAEPTPPVSAPSRRCPHRSVRAASQRKRRPAAPAGPTFEDVVAAFRAAYPGDFASDRWQAERAERQTIATRTAESLSRERWSALVAAGSLEELGSLHRKLFQSTSLLHPVQALRVSAIRDPSFWDAYGGWVWDAEPRAETLDAIVAGLAAAEQASWPNVTALRAVLHPTTDLLVKPDSIKRAAAALRHDLRYESRPSYDGYRRLLEFAALVQTTLGSQGLRPADLWDVSSFFRFVGRLRPESEKPSVEDVAAGSAEG
jgi:hypothetical protein